MKMKNNPMHRRASYKFMESPRCGAKTRQSTACLSPAVKGKRRCRMHGGANGSGASIGSQNAFKHGYSTREAKELKKTIRQLIKESQDLVLKNSG